MNPKKSYKERDIVCDLPRLDQSTIKKVNAGGTSGIDSTGRDIQVAERELKRRMY